MTAETPRDRLRRLTAELVAKLNATMQEGGIRSDDPVVPVFAGLKAHAIGMGAVAAEIAEAAQHTALSLETETRLIEHIGRMAATAVRVETSSLVRGTLKRFTVTAVGGAVIAFVLVGGGGYWVGSRSSMVTLQVKPGETATACVNNTVQPAPDGHGRVCAAWVRLDQATLAGPGK